MKLILVTCVILGALCYTVCSKSLGFKRSMEHCMNDCGNSTVCHDCDDFDTNCTACEDCYKSCAPAKRHHVKKEKTRRFMISCMGDCDNSTACKQCSQNGTNCTACEECFDHCPPVKRQYSCMGHCNASVACHNCARSGDNCTECDDCFESCTPPDKRKHVRRVKTRRGPEEDCMDACDNSTACNKCYDDENNGSPSQHCTDCDNCLDACFDGKRHLKRNLTSDCEMNITLCEEADYTECDSVSDACWDQFDEDDWDRRRRSMSKRGCTEDIDSCFDAIEQCMDRTVDESCWDERRRRRSSSKKSRVLKAHRRHYRR